MNESIPPNGQHDFLEGYGLSTRATMGDFGLPVGPVPAVDLKAFAAQAQDSDVRLCTGFAEDLLASEVCVV